MIIGHYAPDLWARGGIAAYVHRLAEGQRAAGHTVFEFGAAPTAADATAFHRAVRDEDDLYRQARASGLDVLHLHRAVRRLPVDGPAVLRTMHGHQGSCPSATRYLARIGQPCDRRYHIAGCLLAHVVDRCGSVRPRNVATSFARIRHEHALAAQVHTVTVSHYLRRQMVRAGCPDDRLYTLPSPAPEAPTYRPPARDGVPRFAFFGRLVPQKGLAWLLRAMARAAAPIHLDVAGEGPQRAEMEQLTATLGLAGRVSFHGWLAPSAVHVLMQRARAVVVPSVWHEPAGLVTLEAAACGRAVVAARVGGIPEYAREGAAMLAAPHDVATLAAHLSHLADDPAFAERLGRHGRALARTTFALPRFVEALDALYRRALADHRADAPPARPTPATAPA